MQRRIGDQEQACDPEPDATEIGIASTLGSGDAFPCGTEPVRYVTDA